MYEPDLLNRAN